MSTESYDQLAIFAAVSRERRFTRAAVKLGMSQPALSRGRAPAARHRVPVRRDQHRASVAQRIPRQAGRQVTHYGTRRPAASTVPPWDWVLRDL